MYLPFKPLCMLGVFGVVGIVGAVRVIRPTRIAEFFRLQLLAQQQEVTNKHDTPVTNGPGRATPATGSGLSLGVEGPTITTQDIERLKASLEELKQLLQDKSALELEISRLRLLLEAKTTALSSTEEAKTSSGKVHELETKITIQTEEIKQLKANLEKQEQLLQEKTAGHISMDNEQIKTLISPIIVNKADSISVAEVADLVRILNAQIEQTSSLIVDSLLDQASPSTGEKLEIVWDELNDYIGSWLCNDLKRRSKELIMDPDPLIMQITLQTGLVNACSRIINDWNPPFWIDGSVFSRTHSNIEKAKGLVTADAWRALSRTHMTVLRSERQEANKRYLTDVLLKLITAVGGSPDIGGILLSQYNEKVEDIVQRAVGLHKTVHEDVTLMELVTYTSPSDTSFDASQMEDTEGGESEGRSGRVVCTVDMGLRYKKGDESGKKNGSREEWGVTMKSRVVLAATLEA